MELYSFVSPWSPIAARASRPAAAVADVHGRADLLEGMFSHLDFQLPSDAQVVLLGDLIDRGPESLRAIDVAMRGCPGRETVALAGNHESMLICAMQDDPRAAGAMVLWFHNGGETVLEELGIDDTPSPRQLADAVGTERKAYLERMRGFVRNGDVLFVHAGIDVARPLHPQLAQPITDFFDMEEESESIRWIRGDWVGHDEPLEEGVFVVCGHTIQRQGRPLVTSCQAMIDLGAYSRNVLCATEVDPAQGIRHHFVGEFDRVELLKDHYTGGRRRSHSGIVSA